MNRPLSPFVILPVVLLALTASSCTTVENRRDLYFPQTVWGPYTRMLHRALHLPTAPKATGGTTSSSDGKSVLKPSN